MSARARRLVPIAAFVVLVVLVTIGAVVRARNRNASFTDVEGVRLGMTVRDVRQRFDSLGPASWTSSVSDDVVLKWKPTDETRGRPLAVTFEFHMGILMAIRADLSPQERAAKGPPFELSDSTVVVRTTDPNGTVHLTAIARSCPIHAQEASKLVESHAK